MPYPDLQRRNTNMLVLNTGIVGCEAGSTSLI